MPDPAPDTARVSTKNPANSTGTVSAASIDHKAIRGRLFRITPIASEKNVEDSIDIKPDTQIPLADIISNWTISFGKPIKKNQFEVGTTTNRGAIAKAISELEQAGFVLVTEGKEGDLIQPSKQGLSYALKKDEIKRILKPAAQLLAQDQANGKVDYNSLHSILLTVSLLPRSPGQELIAELKIILNWDDQTLRKVIDDLKSELLVKRFTETRSGIINQNLIGLSPEGEAKLRELNNLYELHGAVTTKGKTSLREFIPEALSFLSHYYGDDKGFSTNEGFSISEIREFIIAQDCDFQKLEDGLKFLVKDRILIAKKYSKNQVGRLGNDTILYRLADDDQLPQNTNYKIPDSFKLRFQKFDRDIILVSTADGNIAEMKIDELLRDVNSKGSSLIRTVDITKVLRARGLHTHGSKIVETLLKRKFIKASQTKATGGYTQYEIIDPDT